MPSNFVFFPHWHISLISAEKAPDALIFKDSGAFSCGAPCEIRTHGLLIRRVYRLLFGGLILLGLRVMW